MSTKPPRVVTAALVLPLSMVEAELPAEAPDARHGDQGGRAPRRRARSGQRTSTRAACRTSRRSTTPASTSCRPIRRRATPIRIEVKARIAGAEDFFVTHNEVLTGKNAAPRYRLALVSRRSRRAPSTTRSATSTTRSPASSWATSTRRAHGSTGTRPGPRDGTLLTDPDPVHVRTRI